jgi:hypothetical protein
MAFPYVLLANFRAFQLQRQAMTTFLRGQIWLTCVGPRGFLGNLLKKKLQKTRKAISQALFICHNLAIHNSQKKKMLL